MVHATDTTVVWWDEGRGALRERRPGAVEFTCGDCRGRCTTSVADPTPGAFHVTRSGWVALCRWCGAVNLHLETGPRLGTGVTAGAFAH